MYVIDALEEPDADADQSSDEVKMEQMFSLAASTEGRNSIDVGLQSWSRAGSGKSSWAELSRTELLSKFLFNRVQRCHRFFTNVSL